MAGVWQPYRQMVRAPARERAHTFGVHAPLILARGAA
jgi:hypothetical protein